MRHRRHQPVGRALTGASGPPRRTEHKMPRGRPRKDANAAKPTPASQLTLERNLFLAADRLRKNLEPSDYKHVVLGLIFLRHISLAFEARHETLMRDDPEAAEHRDEYIGENIFWVPKEARWSHLQANAPQPTIGRLIDEAMAAIEAQNPTLKGMLPKTTTARRSTRSCSAS